MCSGAWPMLLDLTKDECKRILRNMELEAYGSMVSVFRAQGDLTKEKKRLLKELQQVLSIPTERHRAEIRRAVNDEKFTTVAQCIAGADTSSEWHVEGRRLVPILPRLVPQTAFTMTADTVCSQQAQMNRILPPPSSTGNKELAGSTAPPPPCSNANVNQGRALARGPSPTPSSNVLVLPSGMSIQIKDEEHQKIEEENHLKQKRKTYSTENLAQSRPQVPHIPTFIPSARTPPVPSVIPQHINSQVSPPLKFTTARSPVKQHTVTTTPAGQKVIIVSSAATNSTPSMSTVTHLAGSPMAGSSTYAQRPVSAVPLVRSSTTTSVTTTVNTVMYPRPSIMVSGSSNTAPDHASRSNVITIAGSGSNTGSIPTAVYHQSPTVGTPRQRVRTITARPRTPHNSVRAPNTPQSIAPTGSNIHIRPAAKPTIHIKQEGGMKIITQGTPATAGRILPKPAPSHLLVVSTAPSTIVNQRAATQAVAAGHMQAGKVLNISTSVGHILATSAPRSTSSSVVTVNPKTLQLTTIRGSGGISSTKIATPTGLSKPNVIVVQKAQSKKGVVTPTVQVARASGPMSSPFEKELVSFLQRQEPGAKAPSQQQRSILERKIGRPLGSAEGMQKKHVVVRQKADGGQVRSVTLQGGSKSSILAELIQAVSMSQESSTSTEHVVSLSDGTKSVVSAVQQDGPQNQWVEYDVQSEGGSYVQHGTTKIITSEATDVSAIKAMLDLQSGNTATRVTGSNSHRSAIELNSLHGHPGGIRLEPISAEERLDIDPDIQIVGTSGLDDVPSTMPITVKRSMPYMQRQKIHVLDESTGTIQLHVGPEQISQGVAPEQHHIEGSGQEIIGEIDPRTGELVTSDGFHSASELDDVEGVAIQVISSEDHEAEQAALLNNDGATKTIILNTSGDHNMSRAPSLMTSSITTVIDPSTIGIVDQSVPSVEESAATEKVDFLSNALNQAQIDLDCYQFGEEDGGQKVVIHDGSPTVYVSAGDAVSNQATTLVSILSRPSQTLTSTGTNSGMPRNDLGHIHSQVASTSQVEILEPQENLPDLLVSTPASTLVTPSNRAMTKITTLHGKTLVSVPQIKPKTQFIPIHEVERKGLSTIHIIKSSSTNSGSNVPLVSSVSVASEPGSLDPGHLKLEDLTSQQLDTDLSEEVLVNAGFMESAGDIAQSIRLSKRKRKAPLPPDEISSPPHVGWPRLALGVLQRVMRIRGAYKEKGEMNAASWFTQPVDPREVPDYYNIIENPMDFATIKKKLEASRYMDIEDFHSDMLLVRDNCHRYNPPGTEVRRDCDEVFSTYSAEYERLVARWQQSLLSSPNSKKLRLDKSPVRH